MPIQWNKVLAAFCSIGVLLDPLFLYLIYIDKENKCFNIDWETTTYLVIIRSVGDLICFLIILAKFRLAYISLKSWLVPCLYFFFDLFIVLPVPQIIIMFILPTSLGLTGEKYIGNVLHLPILLQYLYRMFRFFPCLAVLFSRGIIYESAKTNVIKSIVYYILFTNVVSSLWYLSGIQRVNQCLQEACHLANEPKCTTLMNCNSQWQNISATWSGDNGANNCLSETSSFSYGIFSRILPVATETYSVMNKYVMAIFWGLQQVTNFARNLSPSHSVWEIRFTWFIAVVGLLLYGHLIYNTAIFLYIFHQRMQEMHLRRGYVD